VAVSLRGFWVSDPHLGFAFNSFDSFERLSTCRFDSRFGCHVGANALYESVQLGLVNLRKRSNLVTSDYYWTGYINPNWIWTNARPNAQRPIPIHVAVTEPNPRVRLFSNVIHMQPYTTIRTKFIRTKVHTHKGSRAWMFVYSIDGYKDYASNEMDNRMEASLGTYLSWTIL